MKYEPKIENHVFEIIHSEDILGLEEMFLTDPAAYQSTVTQISNNSTLFRVEKQCFL